ncbi:PorT family protein [Hymenobacter tibetensis]|uniref:PorT family protein n=1 Tax=Hymenobacter tibetensis TaxID=497967 RepID=A0ABY4CZ23_9BACT|nr:porin family protein [Hymenobacter tibetensis]UOG75516.1 PorT family protein [Hymenobacter tibetensis]
MKKLLFSFSLLLGLAGAAQAQSDVSLGLKAGGTLSSFAGKEVNNYESVFGFHGGAFANIGFTKLFAFQPELIYSQKGAKIKNAFTQRLSYLDVPLAFHVNADGLFFEAGPQVGFLLAAQNKTTNTSIDSKDAYNTVDFGYLFGLGYQRKSGIGIGLRYNGGITKVDKSYTVGNITYQDNLRNSAFQLYLTYSFNGR